MWTNEKELAFLRIYKTEPILWEHNHEFYRDKSKMEYAWIRVSKQTGFSLSDLKRKKESLMATYRGHLRKIKKSQRAGSKKVHKPIWFAFEVMNSFLGHLYKSDYSIKAENHVSQSLFKIIKIM